MTLFVAEMSCASCVAKIEQAFAKQSGLDAKVNLADKQVRISGATDDAQVLAILASVGFQGQLIVDASQAAADKARHDKAQYRTRIWQAGFGLAAGVPLMLWGLLGGSMTIDSSASQLGWGIVGLLTLALMVLTGSHFYRGFWRSLKAKSANMDTLIALGTASAWLFSMLVVLVPEVFPAGTGHVYFEASVMILGLINLGHALELRARGKTSEAVQKLLGLQANTAVRVGPQGDEVVAISDLALGDVLRLKPGDRVALDGVVVSGESLLDESMLTGEPLAVSKALGDGVSAGTVNGNGALTYQVSAIASDTKLAKIISLVQEAQTSKMPIGRLTDKIAAYFVPVVVVIALLASAIWLGFGPTPALSHALVVLVSVLIIACPCALGLATPMSIMVAVGRAAQMGVLIKNGEALQTASKVTTVVLDKTGTITLGKPQVTDIMLFNQASSVNAALTQEQVLSKVASLEMASSHPLAAAIIDSASVLASHASNQADVTDFINHQGQGLSANIGAATWLVGNQSLMLNHDIAISAEVDAQQLAFTAEGKTPVWVGASGELVALIMISDPLKADAKEAVTKLKQQGLRVVMLSGDNQVTAQAVAKKVGIDEVIAQVLPHEKQAVVLDLQRQGEVVAMVGDGINDAPALMSSDVGIAMGSGTEVAIESADITLLSHQLMTLVDALALSRASMRNIKQNLFGAFIYNTLGIPIAAGVLFPVFGILLSPVVAGGAMALSSLTVVMNANRLKSTRLH
ncbi:heavy metal translocating P-type ATPase [Shewanella sp. SNU WT4]|uniref:heavy metal translocating P-type ATPase n=1 Tax=Shewanella sp. SNU WT4 TaxID=2590015 RepID=UPI00112C2B90|nr:heavy metal translocating P-type ATPase [Shewanella sp. SNU WT4]QDF68479.1 heavy metal translocating P-type ATPase [Shewanella sp. SNU WT4]